MFDAGTVMDKPKDLIPMEFLEVEHKFILGEDFDKKSFLHKINSFSPTRIVRQSVEDTYYVASGDRPFIYRHRYDQELQHLTVKGLGQGNESRLEINLDLGQHQGNQEKAVAAFLSTIGIRWHGKIQKQIEVFHFSDCEIVYYSATNGNRWICCIEFEAHGASTMGDALKIVHHYEKKLGFNPKDRSHKSLFELIFPDVLT